MKVTILGSGNPVVDAYRGGPGIMVALGGDRLLFDCGRDTCTKIVQVGEELKAINPLFISHFFHFDHTCDLVDLAVSGWVAGRAQPLQIYGPSGVSEFVRTLFYRTYREEIASRAGAPRPKAGMTFDLHDIDPSGKIEAARGQGWKVLSAPVRHGKPPVELALAYRLEREDGKAVTISGDTARCDALVDLARGAETFICECNVIEGVPRTQLGTHMDAEQVGRVCQEAGVRQVVLYHLQPWTKPARLAAEVRKFFAGTVIVSEDGLELTI